MTIPRIVIAGTNSGCGKTTVASGIMAALFKKGLKVQPYKVGPDYIDPMFHTFVTGRHSRNLDSWMLEEKTVAHLFARSSLDSDIAVVEGVMGFYDGFGGYSTVGSTAHVSKIIKAPVILVVNGEGASTSLSAVIQGFKVFDRDADIKGVIINNIRTDAHYRLLKETIEENTGLAVVGYLPKTDRFSLTSRHLGLVPSGEIEGLKEKIDVLAEEVSKCIDLELLTKIAGEAPNLDHNAFSELFGREIKPCGNPVIAVALDKAFNFYYRDNLELLETLGAKLRYFSPIEDTSLPDGINGLYIGGGYPEVWAAELQENAAMRADVGKNIMNGLPAYAECGGLMYMTDSITDKDENTYGMVGVIPGKSRMTLKLQRFGYVELEMSGGNVLTKENARARAHEFHYSSTNVDGELDCCYRVIKHRKSQADSFWTCGYRRYNLLAGYPHIHFWSNTRLAEGFVDSCMQNKIPGEYIYGK